MSSFLLKLPDRLKEFADPALPREMRLKAARGVLPLLPSEMILVLFSLVMEDDAEISDEASKSIESIPENVMGSLLTEETCPPEILHYIARTTTNEAFYERIILNHSTDDVTITHLAKELENPALLDLIASNQRRLIHSEPLFEALSTNPALSRSTLDRLVSFLNLYFTKERGVAGEEAAQEGVSEDAPLEESFEDMGVGEEELKSSFLHGVEIPSDMTEEHPDGWESDEGRESLYLLIKKLKVVEKIKLALLGNKEARTYLARDAAKVIVSSVLKNPKITDTEIIALAQSTSVDNDILRQISLQRKWMKSYAVKLALANNPKTAPHISMGILRYLMEKDLKHLSGNRNVSAVVASAARRLLAEKKPRG